jgi:hypothetical protein
LYNNDFDVIRAASAVQLQLDPGTATAAPEPLTRADPSGAEPAPAAAASEPSTPGEPTPPELAPEADATLLDLPPPELWHDEAETGGGEQVEAPDAAPTDGTGKRLPARGLLLRPGHSVLTTFVLAGVRQPPPEDIAGSSRNPREVLRAGPGYKNVITTDLVDDTLLSAENLRTFKSTFKELYDFSMVRLEWYSGCAHWWAVLTRFPPIAQHVITKSQKKSERLGAVVNDAKELAALDKRISEEKMKNCYLQWELDILKQERTREVRLLKNDLKNLEGANTELQKQLKEQQVEYQEQLKLEKKVHQGRPPLPSSTFSLVISLGCWNILAA